MSLGLRVFLFFFVAYESSCMQGRVIELPERAHWVSRTVAMRIMLGKISE